METRSRQDGALHGLPCWHLKSPGAPSETDMASDHERVLVRRLWEISDTFANSLERLSFFKRLNQTTSTTFSFTSSESQLSIKKEDGRKTSIRDELWKWLQEGRNCDLTIAGAVGVVVKAHSAVMVALCPALETAINYRTDPTAAFFLILQEAVEDDLISIVEFCYRGVIGVVSPGMARIAKLLGLGYNFPRVFNSYPLHTPSSTHQWPASGHQNACYLWCANSYTVIPNANMKDHCPALDRTYRAIGHTIEDIVILVDSFAPEEMNSFIRLVAEEGGVHSARRNSSISCALLEWLGLPTSDNDCPSNNNALEFLQLGSVEKQNRVSDGGGKQSAVTSLFARDKEFVCKQCDDSFVCLREYRYHLKSHGLPAIYKCEICSKVFLKKSNLTRHEGIHKPPPHEYDGRGKKYTSEENLGGQTRSQSGYKAYGCPVCSSRFASKTGLNHHLRLHERNRGPMLVCEICGKEFTRQGLWGHMKTHSKEYSCPNCDRRFATPSALKRHAKWVHEPHPQLNCHICFTTFDLKSKLDRHSLNEHGYLNGKFVRRKAFPCDKCSQSFQSLAKLERHAEVKHATKETVGCPICGKLLSGKSAVKYHMRAHTGERPHKCLQCPKAFTRPDLLKKHNRVHTGQRFTCLVCGKSFTSKHYLTEHSWTHGTPAGDSPPVEYCCGWCKQTFPTVELFKQHSKVHLQKTQNTLAIQGKPVNVDKAVTNEYNRLSGLKPLCWDLNDDGANVSNMGSPGASTSEGLGNHGNIAPESEVTVIQNYGCSETFDSPNLLEKHASGNEPVTFCDTLFYNCKFCHLTFEDLSLLEGHTWSHLMDDSVQIDIDDNDMMECHLHSCASCSLVFITREQLEEHQCPTFYLPTLHYQP